MSSRNEKPERVEDPDVEMGAIVKARRLRFERKPRAKVSFRGGLRERGRRKGLETSSGSERENLPEEVEPDVTYRDVQVKWRAAAKVAESEDVQAPDNSAGAA